MGWKRESLLCWVRKLKEYSDVLLNTPYDGLKIIVEKTGLVRCGQKLNCTMCDVTTYFVQTTHLLSINFNKTNRRPLKITFSRSRILWF